MPEDAAESSGPHGMADPMAQAHSLIGQIEDLEARLSGTGAGEVELTLLEQATEVIEEAGRLLERLGHAPD